MLPNYNHNQICLPVISSNTLELYAESPVDSSTDPAVTYSIVGILK